MVFSSLFFLLAFLPVCLICYYFTDSIKIRNAVLLVFSLIFYAWGEPVYVIILVMMSLFTWLFSMLIELSSGKAGKRAGMILACVVCIGSIGVFKYAGLAVETINSLAGKTVFPVPQIALPIGISFYTFQLLTYVADVYRGEVPAQKSWLKVLLYAGMFHQCIAGPIVRYGDIAEQIENRRTDMAEISKGVTRFSVGLAKKALLANYCGAITDTLLLSDADMAAMGAAQSAGILAGRSSITLLAGMAFYMLQIYLDFSAYSDMAIGMGLMCGFRYKENFNYPYTSNSVTEFWRRWHISLGSFFRDYVYIPLGGNRRGMPRQIFNMFVVWALTGLWHGANWNFVLWGLYFFVFLVLEKLFLLGPLQKSKVLSRIYLLAVVYFGWILFRFTDMGIVGTVFRGIFMLNGNSFVTYESRTFVLKVVPFFIICCLACTPVVKNLGRMLKNSAKKGGIPAAVNGIVSAAAPAALILLSVISLVGDSYNPFLYFKF